MIPFSTVLVTAAILIHTTWAQRSTASVNIKNGTVTGLYLSTFKQDAFLGIPFAQAPVGDLRLAPPMPLNETWSTVLNATRYYPRCAGYGNEQNGKEQSEDCLALNIVRPAGYENTSLPVAVWIHGGAFAQGGTIDTLYNLSYIIQNSVSIGKPFVGVSIAYRLNGFGFLNSKEIQDAGATNLGLRDQRLALQWVQENIRAFGGDAQRVTIWGESAGAYSVGYHLIAYGGRDDKLFSGAIMQSGHPLLAGGKFNMATEQAKYDAIVRDSGCDNTDHSLSCLRELPYDRLNHALNGTLTNDTLQYTFFPYVDGDFIQGSIHDQLNEGRFVKVPILNGANSDDSLVNATINTDDDFRRYLRSLGSSDNTTISILESLYPKIPGLLLPATVTEDATAGLQYKRVKTFDADFTFIAGRRLISQTWSRFNQTAYSYRFNVLPAPGLMPSRLGVTHWVDVAYVFDNPIRLNVGFPGSTPSSNVRLAKLMSRMWASFIHDGNPNEHLEDGYPEWPVYKDGIGGYGQNFVFDVNVTSHIEQDVFRGNAIAYVNHVMKTQYRK